MTIGDHYGGHPTGSPSKIWAMGNNPFKWDPHTAEQDRDRERAYSVWLSANDPDVPWDRVADTLLDRSLGAPRGDANEAPGPGGSARETGNKTSEAVASDDES